MVASVQCVPERPLAPSSQVINRERKGDYLGKTVQVRSVASYALGPWAPHPVPSRPLTPLAGLQRFLPLVRYA